MNLQAANGLLKVLEEPPADVEFLLVSHQRDKCATVKPLPPIGAAHMPAHAEALAYLEEQQVDDARSLLAFHTSPLLSSNLPWRDRFTDSLLQLLAERLLAILDYAADFDRQKWPLACSRLAAQMVGV